jgi:monoamine oxidase
MTATADVSIAPAHSLPVASPVDVAIVGAGLCGLALARTLIARGLRVQVLEARSRLGGRVLTLQCDATDQALDLGATWFWPETEPRITALLAALGLPSIPQHDPGDALWLSDPNRAAERRNDADGVHAGARRIQGGAARLVNALASALPPDTACTNTVLTALRDRGDYVELQTASGATLHAKQVVLALPPRLVREHIQFQPALPDTVWQALADSPTWMAAQAKALVTFTQDFWRQAGQSGNAFVRHPQAVLAEVFDCCANETNETNGPQPGALGGFVALNAAQREHFHRGLPMLIDSQLAQLFGVQAQGGTLFLQDWAKEPWTCSEADRANPPQPPQADPLLRQAQWNGRVFFGGSETAAHGSGHMEGALESADRLAHALGRAQSGSAKPRTTAVSAKVSNTRSAAIDVFCASVLRQRALAPQRYRLHLNHLLIDQQSDLLTQRALLATVEQCYSEALAQLTPLLPALDAANAEVTHGRHALSAALLMPFDGWNKELLDAVLSHNASSCALSNFAQEHRPDEPMLRAILRDLAAAWREFAIELNNRLLMASETDVAV